MSYIRDRRYAIEIKIKSLIRLNSAKNATLTWVPRYSVTSLTGVPGYYYHILLTGRYHPVFTFVFDG